MQGHHLHIAGDIQGDVLSGGNIEEAQSGVIFHSGSELPNGGSRKCARALLICSMDNKSLTENLRQECECLAEYEVSISAYLFTNMAYLWDQG